ncbi:MAG: hypothetical protein Q8K72_04325, partial [Acidimicrobiales bacterium]|nr:hypothetical protein [Acidimicrobiales bacterium]
MGLLSQPYRPLSGLERLAQVAAVELRSHQFDLDLGPFRQVSRPQAGGGRRRSEEADGLVEGQPA